MSMYLAEMSINGSFESVLSSAFIHFGYTRFVLIHKFANTVSLCTQFGLLTWL